MNVILAIRLIDLALLGGQAAVEALKARDKLKAMAERGGPTAEELADLEAESDRILEEIRKKTTASN